MSRFKRIFNKAEKEFLSRQNFQARLFGIFNEEIVRIWAKSNSDEYCDLGRPTVYLADGKHLTFDFLLQKHGKNYLTEMKCWLPFENYAYFELNDTKQLGRVAKDGAFKFFMEIAQNPANFTVKVPDKNNSGVRKDIYIDGVILIWGTVNRDKKEEIKHTTKIHEILSLEDIIESLIKTKNAAYTDLVKIYWDWSNSFFDMLISEAT